jgi:hypothetical protein
LRLLDPPYYFNEKAQVWLNTSGGVSDAVCLLLAGGVISVATVERAIEVCARRLAPPWMQRAIVYRLCADGELDAAMRAADSEIFGDEGWVGWRAVGDCLAREGEAAKFLKLWPKYKAVHRRDAIDDMRRALVDGVSRKQGWRAAVELTHDKRMNAKSHLNSLIYVALVPVAEGGDVRAMDRLLEVEELPGLDDLARLQLLIDSMEASYPKVGEPGRDADHPDLAWVLERIVAIDPKVSKEQLRRRDWLLVDLWSVIGDPATLKKVRGAIRAPMWKRELAGLKEIG